MLMVDVCDVVESWTVCLICTLPLVFWQTSLTKGSPITLLMAAVSSITAIPAVQLSLIFAG